MVTVVAGWSATQGLDIKVEEFSSDAIKHQLDRLEEMVSDQNITEMRGMVRDFIYKVEIFPKEAPTAKKWKRHVHIQSYVRALTMILLASPTGFEPVLPA